MVLLNYMDAYIDERKAKTERFLMSCNSSQIMLLFKFTSLWNCTVVQSKDEVAFPRSSSPGVQIRALRAFLLNFTISHTLTPGWIPLAW